MSEVAGEFFRQPMEEKLNLYFDDPSKTMRLSTSFNLNEENVRNWRDYLRLRCYPPITMQLSEFPSGIMFCPTEEELIRHYLYKKVVGKLSLCQNAMVREYDLYGKEEPWQIWDRFWGRQVFKTEDLFFFTKLKKKTSNGSRIDRSIGFGRWHEERSVSLPFNLEVNGKEDNLITAIRRRFSHKNFNSISKSELNGRWIMLEYSLFLPNADHVLCQLRKNNSCSAAIQTENVGSKRKKSSTKKRKQEIVIISDRNDDCDYERTFAGIREPDLPSKPKRLRLEQESDFRNNGATIIATEVGEGGWCLNDSLCLSFSTDELFGDAENRMANEGDISDESAGLEQPFVEVQPPASMPSEALETSLIVPTNSCAQIVHDQCEHNIVPNLYGATQLDSITFYGDDMFDYIGWAEYIA